MKDEKIEAKGMKIPCCPELIKDNNCDVLFFTRTLNYPFLSRERDISVVVELILGFRFQRCTLGLTLGDPVYSTTLLPGETVKLVTSDRRSQFRYDASTNMSYRTEQMSEEQYFMAATQTYFSDLETSQSGSAKSTDTGRWDFKGDADGGFKPFDLGVGASASASGSHNSSSTLDYLNRQSANMHTSATQAVNATKMAHSVSVGEVATRTHVESESEDHFEASSREFSNKNSCHAVTYIFYRLNKKITVTFELVSVTKAIQASIGPNIARFTPAITPELRKEIFKELDRELVAAGIIDAKGQPAEELKRQFDFQLESHLPTAGVIVKGCLDECNTCEPARKERVHLENELLRKQIELLEQSQEYRCCPGETESPTT